MGVVQFDGQGETMGLVFKTFSQKRNKYNLL